MQIQLAFDHQNEKDDYMISQKQPKCIIIYQNYKTKMES